MQDRDEGSPVRREALGRTIASAVSISVRFFVAFAFFEWCVLYVRVPSSLAPEHLGTLLFVGAVHALGGGVAGVVVGFVLFALSRRLGLRILAEPDGIRAFVTAGILALYWVLSVNVLLKGAASEPIALVLNVVAAVCGVVLALVLLRRAGRGVTRLARAGWSVLIVLVLWFPLYAISNVPSVVRGPRPRPRAVSIDQAALQSPRPSLLFIVIDTVRADCLGCYGSEESRTPNIDRLARQSVLFEQCVTPEPLTRPAVCSMLTGLYPRSHGVDTNTKTLSEDFTTIAEVLRRRGYSTGAFVASTILSADYGTDQGFDVYQEPPEPWSYVGSVFAVRRLHRLLRGDVGVQYLKEYRADEMTRRATEWMRSRGTEPFFAFVHYYDAHTAYAPPEGYRLDVAEGLGDIGVPYENAYDRFVPGFEMPEDYLRQEWLRYLGEIAYVDKCVGDLLAAFDTLEGLDDAVVALVADHGESFEHGYYFDHANQVYDTTVRVPLLVRQTSRLPSVRVSSQVRLIDLFPTLLSLLGAETEAGAQGENLTPLVEAAASGEPDAHLPGFSQTDFSSSRPIVPKERLSLRSPPWKYITSPVVGQPELYDLAADADEITNRADDLPEVARRLAEELKAWDETTETREVAPEQLSDEKLEALRALGYIQ